MIRISFVHTVFFVFFVSVVPFVSFVLARPGCR